MNTTPQKLFTIVEAQQVLGVAAQTVRNYADRGILEHQTRPNGRRSVTALSVWRYIQENNLQSYVNWPDDVPIPEQPTENK